MSVKKRSISFKSADGVTEVVGYFYEDEAVKPHAVLQISHGMCEYIGRYDDLAAYLCGRGFVVCGNDDLGHGATGDHGTDGYFAERDGRKLVLQDLHTMNALAHQAYPELPLVLFGHSMGSFFARQYAADWPDTIDALIICGTGGPNPMGGVGLFLTSLIGAVRGKKYRSKFINNLAFGAYLKRIENPRTPYDWLTHDTAIVDRYAADPKCTYIFTVSAYHEIMALLKDVSSEQWAAQLKKTTPVLVTAGEQDPVGNYGAGVRTVYEWIKGAGVQDATLKLYPNDRHEIHNELDRAQVYADLADWMDARIGGGKTDQ